MRKVVDDLYGNHFVYIQKDIYALSTTGHPLSLRKYKFTATKDMPFSQKLAQPPMEACTPSMINFNNAYIFVIGGTRYKFSSYKAPDSLGC